MADSSEESDIDEVINSEFIEIMQDDNSKLWVVFRLETVLFC